MIHDYDSHAWIARLPDSSWISAEEHSSADPIFATANRVRIEPLHQDTVQAILDAEIPPGYTAFLRTDLHVEMGGKLAKLGYIMAVERGKYPDAATHSLDSLPLIDGFRAELCCWNGEVEFEGKGFGYHIFSEDGIDIYKFIKE